MPKKEQQISEPGIDKETILLCAFRTIQELNWNILFVDDELLIARTPKNWKTYGTEIVLRVADQSLFISSEMVHGEMVDLGNKNQKHIETFLKQYAIVKANTNKEDKEAIIDELRALQQSSKETLQTETKEMAEVDAVMNLSKSNLVATYTIIGINVLVFGLMLLNGAGVFDPNGLVHLQWGSNYKPLTFGGEWWRLVTAMFIHFGIIHIAFNMYAFYSIGIYLEPMLGKIKYIAAYLCTGVFASMASLLLHHEPINSAGASGAIFGMYGLFLAFLTTKLIPKKVRQPLLQSIGIFIVFNLAYGFKSGIDNAAHAGGLVSGFLIGYIFVYGIKKEKEAKPVGWLVPCIILLTAGAAFIYLNNNKSNPVAVQKIKNELKASSYKDDAAFNKKLLAFDNIHSKVLSVFLDTTISDIALKDSIEKISLPQLKNATELFTNAGKMDIAPIAKIKAEKLLAYIHLKEQEFNLIIQIIDKGQTAEMMETLSQNRIKSETLFQEILKL